MIGMRAPSGQHPIRQRRSVGDQTISLGDLINSHDVHPLFEGNVDVGAPVRQAKICQQSICSPHQWKERVARINKIPRHALYDFEHLTPN